MKRIVFILFLLLCSVAQAATWYVGPVATGDGSGDEDDIDNLMAYADVAASTSEGDSVYFRGASGDITAPWESWPTGRLYYSNSYEMYNQVSWVFDTDYRVFKFANGDPGVVGPVSITGISPAWDEATQRHGSMVNPISQSAHGFTGVTGNGIVSTYSAALNVAQGVSASNPLVLTPTSSLISTSGRLTKWPYDRSYSLIDVAAILTVVSAVPETTSFRPPYFGNSSKTIEWTTSDVVWETLPSLAPVGVQSTLHVDTPTDWNNQDETVERIFERPWLTFMSSYTGRTIKPVQNVENYDEESSSDEAYGGLTLCTNLSQADKTRLLYCYIQLGIDNYGVIRNRTGWQGWTDGGGNSLGHKLSILFAGKVLNDAGMLGVGAKSGDYFFDGSYGWQSALNSTYTYPTDFIWFADDQQFFYVQAVNVQTPPYMAGSYGTSQRLGTVSVTSGETTVTRTAVEGQSFSSLIGEIYIAIDNAADATCRSFDARATAYRIASIDSADQVTLCEAYEGVTAEGLSYRCGKTVYYGHAVTVKLNEGSGIYFDSYEPRTQMIGWPLYSTCAYQRQLQILPNFGGVSNYGPVTIGSCTDTFAMHDAYRYSGPQRSYQTALVILMMGIKDEWNNDAYLDYADLWVEHGREMYETYNPVIPHSLSYTIDNGYFTGSMWAEYRDDYAAVHPVWTAKPTTPSPANEATGQLTSLTLSWVPTTGTDKVDIYLGTDPGTMTKQATVDGDITELAVADLAADTRHYWRVDCNQPDWFNLGIVRGTLWWFETIDGPTPPNPPIYVSPLDAATGLESTVTFTWIDGGGVGTFDVYCGEDATPDETELVSSGQVELTFTVYKLSPDTVYYWKVVKGGTASGDVMSFTTGSQTKYAFFRSVEVAAVNIWSGDSACEAVWNFAADALTTDSSGNGNTLTTLGTTSADTTNFKEGLSSCDFPSLGGPDRWIIADAALSAGFPLKNGDSTKTISIACWFRFDSDLSLGEYRSLFGKDDSGKYSMYLVVYRDTSGRHLKLFTGYNSGAAWASADLDPTLSVNNWYHVVLTYNGVTEAYTCYLWDGDSLVTSSGTSPGAVGTFNVEDGSWRVGGSYTRAVWNGQIDEFVVFSDIITEAEAVLIRNKTYGN